MISEGQNQMIRIEADVDGNQGRSSGAKDNLCHLHLLETGGSSGAFLNPAPEEPSVSSNTSMTILNSGSEGASCF